ncbi:hypothetical protein J5N97_006888 [Dioscorea zingiberensis]|uniref:Uncharacterized protein n=1 Tax=Dioscorea zingiberensis TaxID=325984 RepID=A0A9D5HUF4_9LILI|nr:hypothetical protein J5N97_006888 [Dioscorea zingiberensis]
MKNIQDTLQPIPETQRTFTKWDMAAIWSAMVINVPGFILATSLVDLGLSWWQAVLTITLGSIIILAPLILNGYPGTQYGIPFPILLRPSFGVKGAHIPAILRALVSCGWNGIETWIGGRAVFIILPSSLTTSSYAQTITWLGTSVLEFSCYILFLIVQLALIWKGMHGIRVLGRFSSPLLILLTSLLFSWACYKAGGIEAMLANSNSTSHPSLHVFFSSLTAVLSSWSTISLNISDMSRFAKSHSDEILGLLSFPLSKTLFAFAGVAVTSSTVTIFGRLISDPMELIMAIGGTFTTVIATFGISLAVITTNIPCNLVAPSNVLLSLFPSTLNFTHSAIISSLIGLAFQPWRILGSSENYVYTWLGGYSSIAGSIAGILATDYYVIRRMVLDVSSLYCESDVLGDYYYDGGFNLAAIGALIISVAPTVPGFLQKVGILKTTGSGVFITIYDNSWFFGVFCGALVYWVFCQYCFKVVGNKKETTSSVLEQPLHCGE